MSQTSQTRIEAEAVQRAAIADVTPVLTVTQGCVAIVIAALNEASSIGSVLQEIPAEICSMATRVVVVDDGSTDGTGDVARMCGAIVVRHPRNLGQAAGLRTGFAVARRIGASVVVTMDADGQHNPKELHELISPIVLNRADYVQGSRFLGKYDDAGSARHAGIRGFTALINLLTHAGITDCTNGFRAIRVAGLDRMTLVEGRFNAAEIIIEARVKGLTMLEVPVHIRSRETGLSKKPRGLGYPVGYMGSILRSWARARLSRAGSGGAENSLAEQVVGP